MWDNNKGDKKNVRLKVDFKYQKNAKAPVPAKTSSTATANAEQNRNALARDPNEDNAPVSNSPEVIFSELQTLRKKYDAVVEYTVHLTAERDNIVAQLEDIQRELTHERSNKKQRGGDGNSGSNRLDKVEKKIVEKVSKVMIYDSMMCNMWIWYM